MDADGVDRAAVVGYGWCDSALAQEHNSYLLDSAARHPRLVPFCSLHPGWGDAALKELDRCVLAGAKGVGELHPTTQGIDLAAAPYMDEFMAAVQHYRLPVLIHSSEPVGHMYPGKGDTTPERILAFARRYPEATIVCAHWGGGLPFYALMPEVRSALANVYVDTSATSYLYAPEVFPTVIQAMGAERVLFGSDFPLLRAGRVLREGTKALRRAYVSAEEQYAVFHGNAQRLLTLED